MKRTIFLIFLIFSLLGCSVPPVRVEYLSPLRPEFHVGTNNRDRWSLAEPFQFKVDDKVYEVPAGFYTDFASVPRFVWPIISPYELGVGCIPHDFGYDSHEGEKSYWDTVFLACMIKDNIPSWKRQVAYYAVSWFGEIAWEKRKSFDYSKTKKFEQAPLPDKQAEMWQNFVQQATGVK
jgi:hypothetical protein